MKLSRKFTAAALAIVLGLPAIPALADADHGHGRRAGIGAGPAGPGEGRSAGMGMGGMMDPGMMMQMHAMMSSMMGGGMMGGFGPGAMPGAGGALAPGMMGGGMMGSGMMGGSAMRMLDADGDDRVTPEELDAALKGALLSYDADGSGTLSIGEYEAFHSALIRSLMVDRFQALDEDGDGQITSAELAAPAEMMRRWMAMRPPVQGGAPGAGIAPGMGQEQGQGNMGQGGMMNDN